MSQFSALAHQVMARCDELGAISQSDYVDRRYLTKEHKAANALVASWMEQAGMTTWQDSAGNLWGRYQSDNTDAKSLLFGSHLDTVPNGGKYDGMLGVIAPIALIAHYHQQGRAFPYHIDIVGFGDEEGTRFGSTLLGSRALTGTWPEAWRELRDANGVSLPDALGEFGSDFDRIIDSKIDPTTLLAYIELHIEQGPVLEEQDLPVGVVTAIAGARRFEFEVTGFAGHAGTVPMPLRKDSLAATSEMIVEIERIATEHQLVATVGKIENRPNGVNVIAGKTLFSLDIRSEEDALRDQALTSIMQAIQAIADKRGVTVTHEQTHSAPAVHCDSDLQEQLAIACDANNYPALKMLSGAGHDAMAIADICPVAMLFTRCDKGISHHPAEAIMESDVEASLNVLDRFILNFSY